MINVAAKDQEENELFDRELSERLTFADPQALVHSFPGASVAFLGFSTWRREPNGDGNLSDEQVFAVRNGEARLLEPHNELSNHSPDGLSWGYPGSAAAQLALAMLMAVLDDWKRVQPIYQIFKEKFVSRLPQNTNWTADGADILRLALAIERRLRS